MGVLTPGKKPLYKLRPHGDKHISGIVFLENLNNYNSKYDHISFRF